MEHMDRAEAIRGKTVRLTWTEGPTRGATHEHVFHQDGTVEWHDAGSAGKGGAAKRGRPTPRWRWLTGCTRSPILRRRATH